MPSQQELLLTGVEYGTPPHRDVNVNGEPLTPDGSGRSPNSRASAGVCVCASHHLALEVLTYVRDRVCAKGAHSPPPGASRTCGTTWPCVSPCPCPARLITVSHSDSGCTVVSDSIAIFPSPIFVFNCSALGEGVRKCTTERIRHHPRCRAQLHRVTTGGGCSFFARSCSLVRSRSLSVFGFGLCH